MARSITPPSVPRSRRDYQYAPDPNAKITTGPGLPAWIWKQVDLEWSGPVDRSQGVGFVLISPGVNRLLAFLRIALLAALVARLLWSAVEGTGSWLRKASAPVASVGAVVLCLVFGAAPARAEFPSSELLNNLRAHLLETPECFPHCASLSRMLLDASPDRLEVRIEVDVTAASAVPLPGGARTWIPNTVQVGEEPAKALYRATDGTIWIQLPAGRHQVIARGPFSGRDTIDLPLPLKPHRVEFKTRGWVLHGVHDDGQIEAALQLTRVRDASRGESRTLDPGELPPFVHVNRTLTLGFDWKLQTRVVRVTPAETPVVIEVPLLEGESVTSDQVRVLEGKALVTMPPGVRQVQWTSELEQQPKLELRAPESVPWIEVWRLDVNPIWHVEATGIPPVHQPAAEGSRVREWRPWPGENVTLEVTRPAGVEGSTLTIDSSLLQVRPGLRSTDNTLTLRIRSSRGGQHVLTLPEAALLESVEMGGILMPVRQEGQKVSLPLRPGTQIAKLQWRESRGMAGAFLYASPAVDFGAPSVNSQVELAPAAGRWILWTGGPRLGPAVLFWPALLVLAILSYGLGRIRQTPLRFRHWYLLGIGLTQVSLPAASLVIGWLMALGWRRAKGSDTESAYAFALVQIGLVVLTLAAFAVLFDAIQQGLLGSPEMQIAGNGSAAHLLRWYQDRIAGTPALSWVLSVPLLVYRLAMLAWALWLALAMVGWLRWGWGCFMEGGVWRPLRPRVDTPRPAETDGAQ
jgi:hypothetical protein